jgi:hypothetical protein
MMPFLPWGGLQTENIGSLLYEERLEAAERKRRDGNDLFAAGQYQQALGKYALVRGGDVCSLFLGAGGDGGGGGG